jgi:hypothetical protein
VSGIGLTIYGVLALTFMMAMYAFEGRHRRFVLAFGCGCLLASSYGFLSGAWPFGAVEAIWAVVAFCRYARDDRRADGQR